MSLRFSHFLLDDMVVSTGSKSLANKLVTNLRLRLGGSLYHEGKYKSEIRALSTKTQSQKCHRMLENFASSDNSAPPLHCSAWNISISFNISLRGYLPFDPSAYYQYGSTIDLQSVHCHSAPSNNNNDPQYTMKITDKRIDRFPKSRQE